MKKTNLKLTVAIGLFIASAFTIFSISSCQKDDLYEINPWSQEEYLDISINATASNMDEWSVADNEAFRLLNERITIGLDENGLIRLKEQSAQEINVSPRLYAIIREIVDNSNKFRLEKAAKRNSFPLTKSGSEEEPSTSASDCVAHSIYDALVHFGITYLSVDNINRALEARYGEGMGVPVNQFVPVLQSYFNGSTVSLNNIPVGYQRQPGDDEVYILAANMSGSGHAAIIEAVNQQTVLIKNSQNIGGTSDPMYVLNSEVLTIFKITGVKINQLK